MASLRLHHKLLIAMGTILLLQAVAFFWLVKNRMEHRTHDQLSDQLLQSNVVFKNFRATQKRLLTTVVRSVAELPGLKAAADLLNDAQSDESYIYKNILEQATGLSRSVGSDIILITDKKGKALARVRQTVERTWEYERAYGKPDLARGPQPPAASGIVQLLLHYPSDHSSKSASPTVSAVCSLPAGNLLLTDSIGFLMPPEQQLQHDGSVAQDMPFLQQVLQRGKGGPSAQTLSAGFWVFHNELFQIAYTPLVFSEDNSTVGAIVVGYRIGKNWAEDIKKASKADVAFFLQGQLVASSFPPDREQELGKAFGSLLLSAGIPTEDQTDALRPGEPLSFDLAGEDYRTLARLLPGTTCHYLVALSWTEAMKPLLALENELKLVGLVVFFVALLLSVGVARGITRPLGDLSSGMAQVMKGDFSSRLRVLTPREIAHLADAFNSMVQGLSEREQYKKMVSRSASELVQRLATSGGEASEVSCKVEATVLFSDIRSFTTLCEGMSPEAVVGMLNEYFEAMGRVIAANDGDIDKFIGDAIMAFFKSTPQRDSAESAVLCAVQMQNEMRALNERRRREGKPEILIGVGVNTGVVVEGHVGTKNRFEHTMLGDAVNVASRLEGECKRGSYLKIVISQSTYDRVQKLVEVASMGSAKLKGKTEELPIYEVKGLADVFQVIGNLDDPSPQVRIRAVEQLARLGTGDQLEPIFRRLADAAAEVRSFTAKMLAQSSHIPGGTRHLIAALDGEKDEDVRLEMIDSLGTLGGFEALEYLRKLLGDSSAAVRHRVVLALESLGGRAAADLLARAAQDPEGQVRATAALALFRVGEAQGILILERMLEQPEPLFQTSATHALGELGVTLTDRWHVAERRGPGGQESYYLAQLSERVAGRLLTALESAAADVRLAAIGSLTRMRYRSAIGVLSQMLNDPAEPVARAAREAISML